MCETFIVLLHAIKKIVINEATISVGSFSKSLQKRMRSQNTNQFTIIKTEKAKIFINSTSTLLSIKYVLIIPQT